MAPEQMPADAAEAAIVKVAARTIDLQAETIGERHRERAFRAVNRLVREGAAEAFDLAVRTVDRRRKCLVPRRLEDKIGRRGRLGREAEARRRPRTTWSSTATCDEGASSPPRQT